MKGDKIIGVTRLTNSLGDVRVYYDKEKWTKVSLSKYKKMCPEGWSLGFNFIFALAPYKVKNESGKVYYGKRLEDVSSSLGPADQNLNLYFMAQGDSSEVDIEVYTYYK